MILSHFELIIEIPNISFLRKVSYYLANAEKHLANTNPKYQL